MKYVKNKSSFQYVFPLPCKEDERTRRQYNTKGNVHIKEIFKIIGLKRRVEVVSMSGETSTEEKVLLHSIVSFHMGRRTHSSIGVHSGIDPMSMSKQLGHSGLEMTSRYVGSDNKKLGGMFDFLGTKKKEEVKEMSKEEKLIELRDLFNKKLITKKVYEEKMKELI